MPVNLMLMTLADQFQEFILRVRKAGQPDIYVGRRYGEFVKLHKRIRTELPGKMLPPLPRKNKKSSNASFWGGSGDDDASSISSLSTSGGTPVVEDDRTASKSNLTLVIPELHRSNSRSSALSVRSVSPRASGDFRRGTFLYREEQRVSLRAFLRTILQNKRVAESKAMEEFLTARPITLNEEELLDIKRRKSADAARIEEQEKFYEIARQRAAELDVYMEKFRRSIVEQSKFVTAVMLILS
jgi:hypothetical protein